MMSPLAFLTTPLFSSGAMKPFSESSKACLLLNGSSLSTAALAALVASLAGLALSAAMTG